MAWQVLALGWRPAAARGTTPRGAGGPPHGGLKWRRSLWAKKTYPGRAPPGGLIGTSCCPGLLPGPRGLLTEPGVDNVPPTRIG